MERKDDNATFEVSFQEHPLVSQQTVQVETILLSVHTDIATPTPVPETDEEGLFEFMMSEIDADAPTLVPRVRLTKEASHRMYDLANSITLLIPVPDFRRMAYVSAQDMMAYAWILPEAVKPKVSVALANMRSKKAAGFHVVARERTTDSKLIVPPPFFSNYI